MAPDSDSIGHRKPARSLSDFPGDLQLGPSIDFREIWNDTTLAQSAIKQSFAVGRWLAQHVEVGDDAWRAFSIHQSDMVREWAAIVVGCTPNMKFARRLAWMKLFADDANSGVREIAWMALRAEVIRDPIDAIKSLVPWTGSRNERLRRFASELTRPCGARCPHIPILKQHPQLGLPILEPLLSDDSKYVQKSVANWLNDASRSQPGWVSEIAEHWLKQTTSIHTQSIFNQALRA